jgi:hypothetical protein
MKRLVSNNKGQFLIETVLTMVLTVGLFIAATGQLKESKALSKLIGGPWEKVSGMIESGVWASPDEARKKHPNQLDRSLSLDPRNI